MRKKDIDQIVCLCFRDVTQSRTYQAGKRAVNEAGLDSPGKILRKNARRNINGVEIG